MHDRLENLVDPDAHLGAAVDRFLGRDGENFLELPMDRGQVGVGQIDLVDHRHDREALFVREMDVGDRLRLDALGGVDDEERAFAGREAARNFVGKIHVAGRIEQVEPVFLAVLRGVTHRHRVRLDRDPALAFEIHRIEELILFLAVVNRAGALEQAIRQSRFAVIDVRDDAEIAGQLDRHEGAALCGRAEGWSIEPGRRRNAMLRWLNVVIPSGAHAGRAIDDSIATAILRRRTQRQRAPRTQNQDNAAIAA